MSPPGAAHGRAPTGFAPIAIGPAPRLLHLVAVPVSDTPVNPARSTRRALFAGGRAMGQLWLFWLAPLMGGALDGLPWKFVGKQG